MAACARARLRAAVSAGRLAVPHLSDRRAGAGAGADRAFAHLPRRLWRHDLARADDGGRHRRLRGGDPRHERQPGDQPELALVAGGAARAGARHARRHLHRLALGAHRGHLHHHDHARGGRGVLLPVPAELQRAERLPGLPARVSAERARRQLARADAVLLPGAVLVARRLFFRQVPDPRPVRHRAAGRARQPAAHARARLQRHRAPRRRVRGGRIHRRGRRHPVHLVQRPHHARARSAPRG